MKAFSIAVIACAAVALPRPLRAATFTVNSTDDGVDTSALGDGVCVTPAHTCTLRAAIMEANALAGADTIILPAGRYELRFPGTDENLGWKGDLDITDDLVITGAGEATTIVDGNHIDRVFDVHSLAHVTLSGVAIMNGEPPVRTDSGGSIDGGGLLNAGTVTLDHVTFARNRAGRGEGWGGGLTNLGTATLAHVTFLHNHAGDAYATRNNGDDAGGAGGMWNVGTATLSEVTFRANRAGDGSPGEESDPTGGECGGLFNDGDVTLTDVTFSLNRAGDGARGGGFGGYGGGMENFGTATLTNVIFDRNRAGNGGGGGEPGDGGGGGGLDNLEGSTATLTDCIFIGNRAGRVGAGGYGGSGGGIQNDGIITLTRVTLDRNRAGASAVGGSGGGLFSTGADTLTNVTITRNHAGDGSYYGGDGGGLDAGDATLTNVTIALNRAGKGNRSYGNSASDQIFVNEKATLTNTIIAGGEHNCDPSNSFVSMGHNLDSGATCPLSAPGDLSNTDPLLEPLRLRVPLPNDGAATPTLALLSGSPAIDAGDNTACPATDQRGVARPQGAACDIGAYEFQP